MDLTVANIKNSLVLYGGRAVLQRPLTKFESDALLTRLATVRRSLMPANGEVDLKRIGRALSAALMGYARADTDKLVRDYTRLLAELPPWAVERACDDIRRGAISTMDPNFPPSAPAIHALASAKMVEARAERDTLVVLIKAPVEELRPEPSPEERKQVLQTMRETSARLGGGDAVEDAARKMRQAEVDRRRAALEEHSRRMQYIVQGYEPPTGTNGKTLSFSLARAIDMPLVKRKPAPAPEGGPL